MKLKLKPNPRNALDLCLHMPSGAVLMITAPMPGHCWLFRVPLSEHVALVAVPEFGGVSLCLESGALSRVLMPYERGATRILKAFQAQSKGIIPRARGLRAIRMIQSAVKKWRRVTA